jgi:hypothetical protein
VLLKCPCGDIHELSAAARSVYENVTRGLPADVPVKVPGGCWRVPRIFIAVHGLKAAELPALAEKYGFEADSEGP